MAFELNWPCVIKYIDGSPIRATLAERSTLAVGTYL